MYTCWSIKLFGSRFEKKKLLSSLLDMVQFGLGSVQVRVWFRSSSGGVRVEFGSKSNFTSDSYVYIQKYMLTFMFNRDLSRD